MSDLTIIESQVDPRSTSLSTWRDWLGVTASVGCAIHCAAMPFVIAYLPAWGLSFLADEVFHKWMALACFLIAIAAFVPGIRRHHNWLPISIAASGLSLITFAAFGLAGECCAACENPESNSPISTVAAEPAPDADAESIPTLQPVEGDTCAGCDHCSTCSENQIAIGDNQDCGTESDWLAVVAPWITPVGGLLLVVAHLLNRRLGCLCGCC